MSISKITGEALRGDPYAKKIISNFIQGRSRALVYFATNEPNMVRANQKLEKASPEELKNLFKTVSDFTKEKLNLKGTLHKIIPTRTQEEIADYMHLDGVSYEELNEFGKKVDQKFINYLAGKGAASEVGKKLDISTARFDEQKLSADDKSALKMFKNMLPKNIQAEFEEYIGLLHFPKKL